MCLKGRRKILAKKFWDGPSSDEAKPDTDTICPFRKRQNALWAPGVCFGHRLSVSASGLRGLDVLSVQYSASEREDPDFCFPCLN